MANSPAAFISRYTVELDSLDNLLAQASAAHGIEEEYTDIWGRTHATPPEVAQALLLSMGVDASSATTLKQSLKRQTEEEWSRALDPSIVVREDAASIPLRVPADHSGASVKLEIQWEDGALEHLWFFLPELKTLEESSNGLVKDLPLPSELRLGYHDIAVYWMREPELEVFSRARFIVCPQRAKEPEKRAAGVAVSLYGLRSSRDWGCGDFTDLCAAIDSLAPAGVAFIALNPLHAIPNRQPYNTSPYLPECSLYRNFIYLDVARTGPLELSGAESAEIESLRAAEFVEYERIAALKLVVLARVFDKFLASGGSPDFDRYVAQEGDLLHHFAVYCALWEKIHADDPKIWLWADWPEQFRDPASPAVTRFAFEQSRRVLFFKFLQWQIDLQLAEAQTHALASGMSIGLYHDLALATDRFGCDLWMNRAYYTHGARVGSPPDDFSPNGQDWGFPPPNRDAHRSHGYELFAQSIRKNARHGGALRIDHVMRFFRLYWIPDEMPATRGAYVRDYWHNLLGIVALESSRGNFVVIGEDLGTVTGEVRTALAERGILSYRLLWFERDGSGNFRRPEDYPAHAVVSSTTHDLATLTGFFTFRDIEARRAAGLIDEAGYQFQLAARRDEKARLEATLAESGFAGDPIGFLLSTPCVLAVINQEDLTGEAEQQNLPGSTWQHPNWRRKMKVAIEDFGELKEHVAALIKRSGRA